MQAIHNTGKIIQTNCPSCGECSTFQYIGNQKWSKAVAEKLGVPTIISLYNCDKCQSTVTGIQLTHY